MWTLSDRLRKAREHAGLGQVEFAEQTGISRRSITNYERGVKDPKKPQLLMWAMRTGVSMEWLVTGQGPDGPDGDGLPRQDSNLPTSDYMSDAPLIQLKQERENRRNSRSNRPRRPWRRKPPQEPQYPAQHPAAA